MKNIKYSDRKYRHLDPASKVLVVTADRVKARRKKRKQKRSGKQSSRNKYNINF